MAGLDLETAAHKAGVKPDRLDAWEQGKHRPTIAKLRKLADVYKRPLTVFYFDEPPADELPPKDFRRFDPSAAEPLSAGLRLVIREARTRRETALDLVAELDEQPPEFGLKIQLDDDPEEAATRLRSFLAGGLRIQGSDAAAHFRQWRMAAENVGVLVFQGEGVDIAEMRGFSISAHPLPAVVLNIKDAYSGRSFSLMHELAHVMLNRGGLCILEEGGARSEVQKVEQFCNHVAGAVLLPRNQLLQEPEIPGHRMHEISDDVLSALARRYGASEEAVLRRLVILDRVPQTFYQRKRAEYQRRYLELREKRANGGFAPPSTMAVTTAGKLFTRLVLQAYDDTLITSSDVSEYLGVRMKHLERIRKAAREEAATGGGA